MKTRCLTLFVLLMSCYWFMSCQSGKSSLKDTTSKNQTIEEELLAKTSLARLVSMQEGTFVLLDSTVSYTLLMKSDDSLMLYSKQFGDVNRDGYWLYQKMYMSSIPDVPVTTDLINFQKISRDSFVLRQFKANREFENADQDPSILKQINVKDLEPNGCEMIFEKIGQLEFKGRTAVCSIVHEGGAVQIFSNYFHVTTKGIRTITNYYRKDGDNNVFDSRGHCYLKKW